MLLNPYRVHLCFKRTGGFKNYSTVQGVSKRRHARFFLFVDDSLMFRDVFRQQLELVGPLYHRRVPIGQPQQRRRPQQS